MRPGQVVAAAAVLGLATLTAGTPTSVRGVVWAAQDESSQLDLETEIDSVVAPHLEAGDFMGVVAVQRDGGPALVLPYGMASIELGVPHRPTDVFMIGSVSKQFTAAAVLLLEEDGALATGDRISTHLPEFPHGDQVTIEQLLTHTSGIADIYSLESFGETSGRRGNFAEVVRDLGEMELTHEPGSTYSYSNGGYALLAAIVEQVSGLSYGEFLARRIFEPLGMQSTAHDGAGPAVENRVPGYDPWGRHALAPAAPVSPAFTIGSGSLWSSAADLLAWSSALHDGRVLGAGSYEKLTSDYGYGYGYGVSVFQRFGRDVIGHDGRVAGYATDVARYLDDRVTVVILSNVQSVARDDIRRLVAAVFFGEEYTVPRRRTFLEGSPVAPEELAGVYSFGPGFAVTVSATQGRLLARANEGGDSELVAISETEWFSRMLYATVRFERDDTGVPVQLVWGRGAGAPVGQRVR